MREPEGIETPPTRKILEKTLVKTLRTVRSQCRGRGFESHHLHQKPRSEGRSGIPQKISFSDVSLRVFIDEVGCPRNRRIREESKVAFAITEPAVAASIDATVVGPQSSVCGSVMTTRGRSRRWSGDVCWSACGHRRRWVR